MAFPAFLIPLIAQGLGSAAGGAQQASSSIDAAQTNAAIQKINLDLQRKLQDQDISRLAPFIQGGLGALPILNQYTPGQLPQNRSTQQPLSSRSSTGGGNRLLALGNTLRGAIDDIYTPSGIEVPNIAAPMYDQTGIYNARRDFGVGSLGRFAAARGMSAPNSGALNSFFRQLNNEEWDAHRGRALDLVKIAQGNAGSAGGSYQRTGNALTNAFTNIGNMDTKARQDAATYRQQWLGNYLD